MRLRRLQHIAVRVLQAFHRQTHRPAINVDPARGTRGQEGPVHKRATEKSFLHGLK